MRALVCAGPLPMQDVGKDASDDDEVVFVREEFEPVHSQPIRRRPQGHTQAVSMVATFAPSQQLSGADAFEA